MKTSIKGILAGLAVVAFAAPALAQFGGPPAAPNTGEPLNAALKGARGHGNVTLVVDPPRGTLCYMMNVSRLQGVSGAAVHLGGAGETGRAVLNLQPPTEGTSSGCQDIAPQLSQALLANPGGYYVAVATGNQPNGAIRGQLTTDLVTR